MGVDERLNDRAAVFRLVILQQGALVEFFLRALGHIDRLHRLRIKAGIEHTGGVGAGGGVKVLHLLGAHVVAL